MKHPRVGAESPDTRGAAARGGQAPGQWPGQVAVPRFAPVWWINPGGLLLLFILPLFLLSTIFGGPLMPEFGIANYLTPARILLGAGCIATLVLGTWVGGGTGGARGGGRSSLSFDPRRFDQVLTVIVYVTLFAHLLWLGPVLKNPQLMLSVLSGVRGANFEAKESFHQIVGVTSLTNLSMVALSLTSVRFVVRGSLTPSPGVFLALAALAPLIVVHAFVGSERLVLVENGVAFLLPLFSFWPRLRRVGAFVPVVGFVLVIAIFALGEYQRSWAYYEHDYNSFTEFVTLRFFAYVSGAANNGAGMVTMMDPAGHPALTGRWLIALLKTTDGISDVFLEKFGNVEFNNPSGIFAPIVDFGISGFLYILAFGVLIGVFYRLYRSRNPIGLLMYPIFFIGFTDLTQIWYWGEPRFIPQLATLLLVLLVTLRRKPVARTA